MKILHKFENQIDIELDNYNVIRITEVESGTIQIENVTEKPTPLDELGLRIYPVGIGTVQITPEG